MIKNADVKLPCNFRQPTLFTSISSPVICSPVNSTRSQLQLQTLLLSSYLLRRFFRKPDKTLKMACRTVCRCSRTVVRRQLQWRVMQQTPTLVCS